MKKRFFIPMVLGMGMMMALPAFAGQIYIGDTETVVSYDENGNPVITLIFDPAKTPDYMKSDSPNYWRKAEQTQTEQSAGTAAQPQTGQAADFTAQSEETLFQKILPLTEPPEVGTVLANIQQEDRNGESGFTEPFNSFSVGQCTWYVRGRFQEVYGMSLPYMGRAGVWADAAKTNPDVTVITDLRDVPERAITVYEASAEFQDWPGHVSFVEYVERDENGKPLVVYYTDANGAGDPEKNAYTPGYDGAVKAVSHEEFLEPYGLKLAGYILPKVT